MGQMTLKEIHERLLLYKMVRQVVEKEKNLDNYETAKPLWLCNVYEGQGKGIVH